MSTRPGCLLAAGITRFTRYTSPTSPIVVQITIRPGCSNRLSHAGKIHSVQGETPRTVNVRVSWPGV